MLNHWSHENRSFQWDCFSLIKINSFFKTREVVRKRPVVGLKTPRL